MVNPKAIVFDLYGTLVHPRDHQPDGFARADYIARTLGLDHEGFARFWWTDRYRDRYLSPRRSVEFIADYMRERELEIDSDQLDSVDHEMGRYFDLALQHPRAEVLGGLDSLAAAGSILGLLSNADEREARTWDSSPLAQYFGQAACFSCHIGHAKPDIEAFTCVLQRLDVDASETVFVGDGMSDELPGARRAGFGKVVFMRGFVSDLLEPNMLNANAAHADYVIGSIAELATCISSR